jgi:hypothetical protein
LRNLGVEEAHVDNARRKEKGKESDENEEVIYERHRVRASIFIKKE